MSEYLIWCDCGWTKQALFPTLARVRLLIHQVRRHRSDPTYFVDGEWTGEGRNGVTWVRTVEKLPGDS